MSASQSLAFSAIAFQLAAALDAYEQDVAQLVRTPADVDLYQRVGAHMDTMRLYAASLPTLAVAWVELMIRHFELTQGMWRWQQDRGAIELQDLHAPLREAIRGLSVRCVHLMPAA